MEYQFFNGWKFPAYETRLLAVDKNGNSTYKGLSHIETALQYVKKFDTFVDVGANVGLVTVPIANKFQNIHAFECVPETYECLRHNTENHNNVKIYNVAVSNFIGEIEVAIPKTGGRTYSSGWASISKERQDAFEDKDILKVKTITLDSLNLEGLDFLKIDVEQAEMMVVKGALETIKKYKPIIEFENKRRENLHVVNLLESIGYNIIPGRKVKSSECIMYYVD